MKELLITAFLLACVTAPAFAAPDHHLEQQLKQQYVGKTMILRHPVEKDSQQYDSAGKLLSGGQEGPWTLYGGMNIRKISLKADELRLEGNRVFFTYDPRQTAMSYVPEDHSHIKLKVALDHPWGSLEEARKVVQNIFAVGDEELLESAPVYWKPFLAKQLGLTWHETPGAQGGPSEKTGYDGRKIFQLNAGSGVRPPKAPRPSTRLCRSLPNRRASTASVERLRSRRSSTGAGVSSTSEFCEHWAWAWMKRQSTG